MLPRLNIEAERERQACSGHCNTFKMERFAKDYNA